MSDQPPPRLLPMLAGGNGIPPNSEAYLFEPKLDGVRIIGIVEPGSALFTNRRGGDITSHYPELAGLADALAPHAAVLDGEVVTFNEKGQTSFQRLQRRMHLTSESMVRRLAQSEPVAYVIFDLLWLDGHSLLDARYDERRERLLELGLNGARWQTPAHHVGDGAAMLEASRAQGLEGIIAKRLDCPYTPGRRSSGWIKVKNVHRTSLVIGGWIPGEGGRTGGLGALTVGFYEDSELQYAGRVGTGFNQAELARVKKLLEPLAADRSPFAGRQPPRETRFVRPELVCDVEYREWTRTRTLRAPSYKGLRDDIRPEQATFEPR